MNCAVVSIWEDGPRCPVDDVRTILKGLQLAGCNPFFVQQVMVEFQ